MSPLAAPLKILWEDDHLVAVAKPAEVATIPGRGETDSVFQMLARQIGLPDKGTADPRLRVLHRLDKDTTGVLLFGKDRPTQVHLSHQFQNNQVQKEYLAIIAGYPTTDEGEIDAPLAPHPTSPQRMLLFKRGRPAKTQWKVEARYRDMALLRVFPKTGKTHQIRVHLQSIGMPLLIDPLYNPQPREAPIGLFLSQFKRNYRSSDPEERPLIARLTLHAEKITFKNLADETIMVTCEPPKDFRAAVNQLNKFAQR